jgi:hypothetical protein
VADYVTRWYWMLTRKYWCKQQKERLVWLISDDMYLPLSANTGDYTLRYDMFSLYAFWFDARVVGVKKLIEDSHKETVTLVTIKIKRKYKLGKEGALKQHRLHATDNRKNTGDVTI